MRRGFTLVELLGTLVILSILLIIVFASVTSVINDSKNTVYNKQISFILSGTYDYTLKYPDELPKTKGEKKYISLLKLQKNGFVDDLINPKSKNLFPIDLVISIEYTGGNYKYSDKHSKLYGSYLYKVMMSDANKSNNQLLKPTLELECKKNKLGEDQLVNKISEDTYYTPMGVGSEYSSCSLKEKSNIHNVLEVILDNPYDENGKDVEYVDTTKKGAYYKYFIAIDDNGNSNYLVQNIVLDDKEVPVLTIPESITEIAKSVTKFDLMKDVTCTDNSGKCNVTTEGEITFGVPDSYSIKYVAKDPSGNTSTANRTIRVLDE